eukprot:Filipodium_phascolosomae@DN1056_c0_g1_i1.p1
MQARFRTLIVVFCFFLQSIVGAREPFPYGSLTFDSNGAPAGFMAPQNQQIPPQMIQPVIPGAQVPQQQPAAVVPPKLPHTHHWSIFRYIADYLHLFSVVILILYMVKHSTCKGISLKTQLMYITVFICRYSDLFYFKQILYLVIFKLLYISSSILILILMMGLRPTYQKDFDTCWVAPLAFITWVSALLLSDGRTWLDVSWTFSQYFEGFAMLPQYIFSYREGRFNNSLVAAHVLSLGAYRSFYGLNWVYRWWSEPGYADITSWLGGIINIIFFLDFLVFQTKGSSFVSSFVLSVDDHLLDARRQIEMTVSGTPGGPLSMRPRDASGASRQSGSFAHPPLSLEAKTVQPPYGSTTLGNSQRGLFQGGNARRGSGGRGSNYDPGLSLGEEDVLLDEPR